MKLASTLQDVPETMLWTLHNRAVEAMRPDGIIQDPTCVEIYRSISYDYERHFGKAEPSHAIRSLQFDRAIRQFLRRHPEGTIVNLGEGLETQRFRFHGDRARWLTVDLPEAIEIRERFIEPDQRHLHCPVSALDRKWFDWVPRDRAVFISAQGLFMYFEEREVRQLVRDLFDTFAEGVLMFDSIPRWLSRRTLSTQGWKKPPHYRTPRMPWGLNRNEIGPTLSQWSDKITRIEEATYAEFPRGLVRWLFPLFLALPVLGNYAPTNNIVYFEGGGL